MLITRNQAKEGAIADAITPDDAGALKAEIQVEVGKKGHVVRLGPGQA